MAKRLIFWTPADIRSELGLGRTTVYNLIRACPATFKAGHQLRVSREDFLAWLKEEGGPGK